MRNAEERSRVEFAEGQIIRMILDREMKPGERLPNEHDLAKRLGIGRSTLREATKRLVVRNVLQSRQGAGTFISDKNGVPEDPLGLAFIGETGGEQLALELQDVRLMLEPEICAIVAHIATREQIDCLQTYCDNVARRIENGEDYSEADAEMHRYLAECSGNRVLRNLIPIITSAINIAISATNDENRFLTIKEHQRIVDAIRARDIAGARYTMIAHLTSSRSLMYKCN